LLSTPWLSFAKNKPLLYSKPSVTYDTKIEHVQVTKSVHPLLDAEAIRVVELMPKWIPGKQNGKPVKVYYTLPINFKL